MNPLENKPRPTTTTTATTTTLEPIKLDLGNDYGKTVSCIGPGGFSFNPQLCLV
jgi:hypothetical protein